MKTPGRVPDELWAEVERLLPLAPSRERGGHRRADDRLLLDAILYVLWSGCPWRALPQEFGAWQTVYDRFAEWKRAGIFEQIHAKCLHLSDHRHGIEWAWQADDGTYVGSPQGGKTVRVEPDGSQ